MRTYALGAMSRMRQPVDGCGLKKKRLGSDLRLLCVMGCSVLRNTLSPALIGAGKFDYGLVVFSYSSFLSTYQISVSLGQTALHCKMLTFLLCVSVWSVGIHCSVCMHCV